MAERLTARRAPYGDYEVVDGNRRVIASGFDDIDEAEQWVKDNISSVK